MSQIKSWKRAKLQDLIKYLGFGFYNRKGNWRTKPHLKSVQKFEKNLKEITSRSNAMSIDEKIIKLNQVIRG